MLENGDVSSPDSPADSSYGTAFNESPNDEMKPRDFPASDLAGELSQYRQRIDNSMETQKRQAELIAQLQNKVLEYRRRCSELETELERGQSRSMLLTEQSSHLLRDEPDGVDNKSFEMLVSKLEDEQHRSGHLDQVVGLLREQLDAATQANSSLTEDLDKVGKLYNQKSLSLNNKERSWRNQEQALSAFFTDEHRRMVSLWSTFQRLRHSVLDLRSATERDLGSLKTDLHKTSKSLSSATQQYALNQALNGADPTQRDAAVLEMVNTLDKNPDDPLSNTIRRFAQSQSSLTQLQHEREILQQRVDEYAATNDALEQQLQEKIHELSQLEGRLRRAESQLSENSDALRKLHEFGVDQQTSSHFGRRSRSLSPAPAASDAVRAVRTAILTKDEKIEQLTNERGDSQRLADDLEQKLRESKLAQQKLRDEFTLLNERYNALKRNGEEESCKLRVTHDDYKSRSEKDFRGVREQHDAAVRELADAHNSISTLNTELSSVESRAQRLEAELQDANKKLSDYKLAGDSMRAELDGTKRSLIDKDKSLATTTARLKEAESNEITFQAEVARLKAELESTNREHSVLKQSKLEMETELGVIRDRFQETSNANQELSTELNKIKTEREELSRSLREKQKRVDHLSESLQRFESKEKGLGDDLHETSQKLLETTAQLETALTERNRLQTQLSGAQEQLVRKVQEHQTSLDDMTTSYKKADEGRTEAQRQLLANRAELEDAVHRLDETESRLLVMQAQINRDESDKAELGGKLRKLTDATKRLVNVSNAPSIGVRIRPHLEASRVEFEETDVGRDESMDERGLELAMEKLGFKLQTMEAERNDSRTEAERLRKETTESYNRLKQLETKLRQAEESLTDAEEEKRITDSRLASAQTLLVSQEEAIRSRDDDRRQLKTRLTHLDLQHKAKESQLRQINERLSSVSGEVETLQSQKRQLKESEESWEAERFQLEARMRQQNAELDRVRAQLHSAENDRQSLESRLREAECEVKLNETKAVTLEDMVDKLRNNLNRSEEGEKTLRVEMDELSQAVIEQNKTKDALAKAQRELSAANARKTHLESELASARSQLADWQQRAEDLNSRIVDLQRQLTAVSDEKSSCELKLSVIENSNSTFRASELELRSQLEESQSEKRKAKDELQDIQQRLSRLESERRDWLLQQQRWERERSALKKTIEMLEIEKRKIEEAIHDTAIERQALDKSLTAMERENMDLHKAVQLLQNQIAQLEHSQAARLLDLSTRQREDNEAQLEKLRAEKQRIEHLMENRERLHKGRVKNLEEQLALQKEKLQQEQRRRRDFVEQSLRKDRDISELRSGLDHSISAIRADPRFESMVSNRNLTRSYLEKPLASSTPFETPVKSQDSYKGD